MLAGHLQGSAHHRRKRVIVGIVMVRRKERHDRFRVLPENSQQGQGNRHPRAPIRWLYDTAQGIVLLDLLPIKTLMTARYHANRVIAPEHWTQPVQCVRQEALSAKNGTELFRPFVS